MQAWLRLKWFLQCELKVQAKCIFYSMAAALPDKYCRIMILGAAKIGLKFHIKIGKRNYRYIVLFIMFRTFCIFTAQRDLFTQTLHFICSVSMKYLFELVKVQFSHSNDLYQYWHRRRFQWFSNFLLLYCFLFICYENVLTVGPRLVHATAY